MRFTASRQWAMSAVLSTTRRFSKRQASPNCVRSGNLPGGSETDQDKTDAIPLYTNYAAGWTLTAWDGYISGGATGDPDFKNNKLVHSKNPFAKHDDMTGPYAVYDTLYEAVKQGLTEEDPTTTDWEGCKAQIKRGQHRLYGSGQLGSTADAGRRPECG